MVLLRVVGLSMVLSGAFAAFADCSAEYVCGCTGSFTIKSVCKDVPGVQTCLYCNSNNPCAGQCMECCYRKIKTGEVCCTRAGCSSGQTISESGCSGASPLTPELAAAQLPSNCQVPQPVPGAISREVAGGVTIETANGIPDIRLLSPRIEWDEKGNPHGIEFTIENSGREAVRAHGVVVDLYWAGSSTPFRLIHMTDATFERGGLSSGTSQSYFASIGVTPAQRVNLERVVVALDFAETAASGKRLGSDVAGFSRRLLAEREAQRKAIALISDLVPRFSDVSQLQREIEALGRQVKMSSERYAVARSLEFLAEGGRDRLARELAVRR